MLGHLGENPMRVDFAIAAEAFLHQRLFGGRSTCCTKYFGSLDNDNCHTYVATLANITNMTVTISTESSRRVNWRMWDWIYGRLLEIRLWLKPEMS